MPRMLDFLCLCAEFVGTCVGLHIFNFPNLAFVAVPVSANTGLHQCGNIFKDHSKIFACMFGLVTSL